MTALGFRRLRALGEAVCVLGTVACDSSNVTNPSTEKLHGSQVTSGDLANLLTLTGHIAFVSTRAGNPEIYQMNANGTGVARLTKNAADDGSPRLVTEG
jgi:hypothetical protein